MTRTNKIIAISLAVAGGSYLASQAIDAEIARQGMKSGGPVVLTIWAIILKALPQLGSIGGIVSAILAALGKLNVNTPLTPLIDTKPVEPSTEIELVMAVIEWAKDRKNPERIQRVILAVVAELRKLFSDKPAIIEAAGKLAEISVQTNYSGPPPESQQVAK